MSAPHRPTGFALIQALDRTSKFRFTPSFHRLWAKVTHRNVGILNPIAQLCVPPFAKVPPWMTRPPSFSSRAPSTAGCPVPLP
ncbi:protein of unknown function [Azospirillum baldaniorum]|uniref:Uncharacterized protein n=1 Tax=Azospirillum baldaniorum TaxID=1064539 RepID=A0A9P1NME8_9PROT|nr:protein of unknown function [Azospirillum baldaniorum]